MKSFGTIVLITIFLIIGLKSTFVYFFVVVVVFMLEKWEFSILF